MKMSSRRKLSRRAAFTLIELLIVIAIIAILGGLILGASMWFLNKGPEITARQEINNCEQALSAAKLQLGGTSYLPSVIKLSPTNKYPQSATPGTLDNLSVAALQKMFGRNFNLGPPSPANPLPHDWSGTGATTDLILEGHQALVFYLGGIPQQVGGVTKMTGFSTDPTDPTNKLTAIPRIAPFYNFKENRLVWVTNSHGTNFPCYMDPYPVGNPATQKTQPYAYFSSMTKGNDYNPLGTSDCASLGVAPYFANTAASPQYMNPSSFQIISAGQDKKFYQGGLWNPSTGVTGVDDVSNFSKSKLGAPQS